MSTGDTKNNIDTLAERAVRAADRVKAAAAKGRTDLEQQVKEADQAAKDKASALVSDAVKIEEGGIRRWSEIQQSWATHVAKIQADLADKKADLDAKHLTHEADDRELDALDAISFAEAAVEEAEYTALDAMLARMEADEAEARA